MILDYDWVIVRNLKFEISGAVMDRYPGVENINTRGI